MASIPDDARPIVAIVAGEPSSDRLAAGLICELLRRWPDAEFIGVTGPAMREAGCTTLADIGELSLFGISEVLLRLPRIIRLRTRLRHRIEAANPTIFIGVDAPAFNLGLAASLKRRGIATAQYVAPTAWAWRQGRTRRIRRSIDLLLAIFPFEPDFFARFGITARFVGHPLADQIEHTDGRADARTRHKFNNDTRVLAVLPGSRTGEVRRLGPVFVDAATRVARDVGHLTVIVPAANAELKTLLEWLFGGAEPTLDVRVTDGGAYEALIAADVALVASGTATLEAVIADTPMVIAYRVSAFNAALARCFRLIRTRHVSMPNLLAGEAVVPEYLQSRANGVTLGRALDAVLSDEGCRDAQRQAFARIRHSLTGDTDRRAADAVAELIEPRA
ncbi:lipid-A-disaccharide synthase [Salinisphaera orenii]|uniref:lipid-A-disaccharide synthase n=1 Tax=Salinisphaera orenii TaxID=856731 RepID=UPI000DBE9F63